MKQVIYIICWIGWFFIGSMRLCHGAPDLMVSSVNQVPDPMDLKSNWWDYYDVDVKMLVERKEETQRWYEKLIASQNEETKSKVKVLCDAILNGLQDLIELKSDVTPPITRHVNALSQYTYAEWLALGKSWVEAENALQLFYSKIDLLYSLYRTSSHDLDLQFAAYFTLPKADFIRLISGLTLINGRILLGLEKLQISRLQEEINEKKQQIQNLKIEINNARNKIDFQSITLDCLQQDLRQAQTVEATAYESIFVGYDTKDDSQDSSVEWHPVQEKKSQAILAAQIRHQIAKTRVVNIEAQVMIVRWAKGGKLLPHRKLQEQMKEWRIEAQSLGQEISQWEKSSKQMLQQMLQIVALHPDVKAIDMTQEAIRTAELMILDMQKLHDELLMNRFFAEQLNSIYQQLAFGWQNKISVWVDVAIAHIQAQTKWINYTLFKVGGFPITVLSFVTFFGIIFFSVIVAKLIRWMLQSYAQKYPQHRQASLYVLDRLVYYFVILLGVFIAGSSIGLDLTAFAFIAGAVAIWIGFGLQTIFHSFISGIIILFTGMVRIRDYIALESGERGMIKEVNLRTSVLWMDDGCYVVVPNSDFISKKFVKHTMASSARQLHLPFRMGLSEDKERISCIVIEAAKQIPLTSTIHEPEIWMRGYGREYLEVELVVWVKDPDHVCSLSARSRYFWAIHQALNEHHIAIPTA